MENQALIHVEDLVLNAMNRPITQFGLPAPDRSLELQGNHLIRRELAYNSEELRDLIESRQANMTEEQRLAYSTVMDSVKRDSGHFIFLDAPGILFFSPQFFFNG